MITLFYSFNKPYRLHMNHFKRKINKPKISLLQLKADLKTMSIRTFEGSLSSKKHENIRTSSRID